MEYGLAIDTAISFGSVALTYGDIVDQRSLEGNASDTFLPMLASLIKDHQITLDQLDYIACHQGPGSFSGLRVGASVAQGLSWGVHKPLYGVCGLEAAAEKYRLQTLAQGCVPHSYVWVLHDARLGELFGAAFEWSDSGWKVHQAPVLLKPEEVGLPSDDIWMAIGSGWSVYPELLEQYTSHLISVDVACISEATAILSLAKRYRQQGMSARIGMLELNYVRHRVAQTTAERAVLKQQKALQG